MLKNAQKVNFLMELNAINVITTVSLVLVQKIINACHVMLISLSHQKQQNPQNTQKIQQAKTIQQRLLQQAQPNGLQNLLQIILLLITLEKI